MQIDHKLLSHFDFNMESEQGQLIASVNNANPKGNNQGVKTINFNLISQLLEIQVDSAANGLTTDNEEMFLQKYEEEILPARE